MIKQSIRIIFTALIFFGIQFPAEAADDFYLDFMPVVSRMDRDRGTDNPAYGARAVLGYGSSGPWYIEGQLFGVRSDMDQDFDRAFGADFDNSNFYTSGLGIDAVYAFSERTHYTPFLLFGVGAAVDNPPYDSSDTNAFLNLGAGFVTNPLNQRGLKLRAEVRYLRDYFSNEPFSSSDAMNDWQLGVGISFPLCPPAPKPVTYVPVPEPKPEPPRDSDNDGVVDGEDRCPGTLPGARVDKYGCAVVNQTIRLENVHFEFNTAKLTARAKNVLVGVADSLRNQPDVQVEVSGHTDSMGSDAYNLRLSEKRASSVRQYLISLGIQASRITARGYGEQKPVADNSTDSGRSQNRRVELLIQ